MADTEQEAQWRAEFEAEGETTIRDALNFRNVPYPEPTRQFAFKWLREQEAARRRRDDQMLNYVQWTLWAAIAAVS